MSNLKPWWFQGQCDCRNACPHWWSPGTFLKPSYQRFQFLFKSLDCAPMQIREIKARCMDLQMYSNILPLMPQICCNTPIFVSDLQGPTNWSHRVADLNGYYLAAHSIKESALIDLRCQWAPRFPATLETRNKYWSSCRWEVLVLVVGSSKPKQSSWDDNFLGDEGGSRSPDKTVR